MQTNRAGMDPHQPANFRERRKEKGEGLMFELVWIRYKKTIAFLFV